VLHTVKYVILPKTRTVHFFTAEPLGELTALPRPYRWIMWRAREGREGKGRSGRGWNGRWKINPRGVRYWSGVKLQETVSAEQLLAEDKKGCVKMNLKNVAIF